ncbi:BA75_01902T0 [Komagataella pastoris]|uniref:BA75_01902T0 n=1 Tax=Komagataella pastoris TaxID=4922 RepID=A0A1B2JDD3_PICPA|nr:BA75_01902T0 [Komagataella pastoris]
MSSTTRERQLPCRVKAVYSWTGEESSDLGFIEGDTIEVHNFGTGQWWYGISLRTRMKGMFPSNYVRFLDAPRTPMSGSSSIVPSPNETMKAHQGFPRSQSYHPSSTNGMKQQAVRSCVPSKLHTSYSSEAIPHHLTKSPIKNSSYPTTAIASRGIPAYGANQSSTSGQDSYTNTTLSKERLNSTFSFEHLAIGADTAISNSDNEDEVPPAPPKHAIPISHSQQNFLATRNAPEANSYRPNYSYNSAASKLKMSTDTEVSSYLLNSENSATSAGSLSRRNYVSNYELSQSDRRKEVTIDDLNLVESTQQTKDYGVFVSRPSKHPKFLRKLFRDQEKVRTLDDQLVESLDETSVGMKRSALKGSEISDLERSSSITKEQKAGRSMRELQDDNYLILQPQKFVSSVNVNEIIYHTKISIDCLPLYHVDKYIRQAPLDRFSVPQEFAARRILPQFENELERLRALFVLSAEKFQLQDQLIFDVMDTRNPPEMEDIFFTKKGSAYQLTWLFKIMADELDLRTDIVLGHLKKPNRVEGLFGEDHSLTINHSWISVFVEGEWRLIDIALGNVSNPLAKDLNEHSTNEANFFYFLAKPLELIHSHVPATTEQQHIVPPIDTMVAYSLPPAFQAFITCGLRLHSYNQALCRMRDYEFFECEIELPVDIEIFARVKVDNEEFNTLAQVYWKQNMRLCKVKAFLPAKTAQGFVNFYSGYKNNQKSLEKMVHPLAMSIPITHYGKYRPFKFVERYPTTKSLSQDLYVKLPQCYTIPHNENSLFTVLQYPCDGLKHDIDKVQIVLQSPTGSISHFEKRDPEKLYGEWDLEIKTDELGVWRALVNTEDHSGWCVFAQWSCSP